MSISSFPITEIYTDGACSGNPGPGGFAAILRHAGKVKELSGCAPDTTNNRMELTAAIMALNQLKRPCRVRLFSDSGYLVKGMTEWIPGWLRRNWLNSEKRPVLNGDLWMQLLELNRRHRIEWLWVKGHHGHPENERCDELAKEAMRGCM